MIVVASLGSLSGKLEISTGNGMAIVEGVIRDIHDDYRTKYYKAEFDKLNELKEFIFDTPIWTWNSKIWSRGGQ